MATNGILKFQGTNKATFVGATSNVVIDTVKSSFGIGVDVDGPTSNLHVVGNAYVSTELTVTGNVAVDTDTLFVDTVNDRVGIGTTDPSNSILDVAGTLRVGNGTSGLINLGRSGTVASHRTGLIYHDGTDLKISNQEDGDLKLATNNSNKLVIESSGNVAIDTSTFYVDAVNNMVGIGTTSPNAKLQVNGDIQLNDPEQPIGFGIYHGTHSTLDYFDTLLAKSLRRTADTTFEMQSDGNHAGFSAMDMQFRDIRFYTGTTASPSAVDVNITDLPSYERMCILSNGNVGIGTTDPATPFHISSTNEITTSPAGSSVSQMRYGSTNSTVLFGVSSTAGHISAYDTSSFSTNRNLCFNADGGNVGIGVTGPDARLHIEEPADISATTRLFHTETGYTGGSRGHFEIMEEKVGTGTGWSDFTCRLQRRVDTTVQGYIDFNPSGSTGDYGIALGNSGGGGPGEIMRIDGLNGRVGIGTTTPDVKLHVEGTSSSHHELVKLATWNLYHNNSNSSADGVVYYTGGGSQGTDFFNNRGNFIYVQIPEFSGETLYTHTIVASNSTAFLMQLRDLNGVKPVPPQNTLLRVHGYSKRTDPYGNITTRGNVGIGTTGPDERLHVVGNIKHEGLTMTSGTDVDQMITIPISLSFDGSTWYTITSGSSHLTTGTWIVKVYIHSASGAGSGQLYDETYSGMFTWYSGGTNSTVVNDIALHNAGHAPNGEVISMRTRRTGSGGVNLILEINSNISWGGTVRATSFFCRRLL